MFEFLPKNRNTQEKQIYFDCTFGAGGYSKKILQNISNAQVFAIDQDENVNVFAQELSNAFPQRFHFENANFADLLQIAKNHDLVGKVHGIVMDLGFSSMQIDTAKRGFSFMQDGPLDMRMNQNKGQTAADFLNTATKKRIYEIIKNYGEENNAAKISEAIIDFREKKPLRTTSELANLIENLFSGRGKLHPATKTFQALRIFINNEIDNLIQGIWQAVLCLSTEGRLIITSFHGLECRVIKAVFQALVQKKSSDLQIPLESFTNQKFKIITKKAAEVTNQEIKNNIRSRSAKIRVLEKTLL